MLKRFVIFNILLYLTLNQLIASPSGSHIELHTFEEISEKVDSKIRDKIPFFLELVSKETDNKFFGYHGMSQKSRLFQDILEAVFEEILKIKIPENFYFLRIPGYSYFDWDGKDHFISYFRDKPVPDENRELILGNFILTINKALCCELNLESFSTEEKSILWTCFRDHIEDMRHYYKAEDAIKYSLPTDYEIGESAFNKNLSTVAELIYSKAQMLEPSLTQKCVHDWLEQYFSFQGGNSLRGQEIAKFYFPFDDTEGPQNSMLLSINTSIFGNYSDKGSFTAGIFLDNQSVLGGDDHLKHVLEDFFDEIGLDTELAAEMWDMGIKKLSQVSEGCLLQFFDESIILEKLAFSLLDQEAYICFRHGIPVEDLIPSKYVQGEYSLERKPKDLEIRLLMNSRTTLNPFFSLRMIRYDPLPENEKDDLYESMRDLLKDVSVNEEKVLLYLKKLEEMWQVSLINNACKEVLPLPARQVMKALKTLELAIDLFTIFQWSSLPRLRLPLRGCAQPGERRVAPPGLCVSYCLSQASLAPPGLRSAWHGFSFRF